MAQIKSVDHRIGFSLPHLAARWRRRLGEPRHFKPAHGWGPWLEVALILAWSLWTGRAYLDLLMYVRPLGADFPHQIMSHFAWEMLPQCGACMLWNGSMNGGSPAFAELQGAILHPVVALTTLLYGAVNSGKLTVVAGLFFAGLAQWWLARVMGLGWFARLWAAFVAVAAGHLSGRMENGLSNVVLSIGATSLVLAPLIDLAINRRRRAVAWLAITLALAFMAGQGYMQIALLIGVLPVYLVTLLVDGRLRFSPEAASFLHGLLLALLLAGVLLAPALHFWPQFSKEADLNQKAAQPLRYLPLNLVIDKLEFYQSDQLLKVAAPSFYMIFTGWIPVLLAVLALTLVPREKRRLMLFFLIAIVWLFVFSSREFLTGIRSLVPQVVYLRFPALMTAMVVPLLLALAAWSVDILLRMAWPSVEIHFGSRQVFGLSSAWLVVALPAILALRPVTAFSAGWYKTDEFIFPSAVIEQLRTAGAEWVMAPFGEAYWAPELQSQGFKLTGYIRPWNWRNRTLPAPYIEASRYNDSPDPQAVYHNGGIQVFVRPENEYAFVAAGEEALPCRAQAHGGFIDVLCDTPIDGSLVVHENAFSGWQAWVDGKHTTLTRAAWLTVPLPAGQHVVSFRYRPADVWLGLALTLMGAALTIREWRRSRQEEAATTQA